MIELRTRIREKFEEMIEDKKNSKNLEIGIYNYTIKQAKIKNIIRKWCNSKFVDIYLNRFRTLFNNLNPNSMVKNNYLLDKIKKNEITPQELAFMSHYEMFPDKWKDLIEKKTKRDKMTGLVDLSSATDEFKCYKCKQKNCSYYQLQTRSADEPMTTYVSCLNCGNNWKC